MQFIRHNFPDALLGRLLAASALVLPLITAAGGSTVAAETKCTNPVFTTSSPNGGWSNGGYYVHNNMWNSASYPCSETLYACSYNSWYVDANMNNNTGDGAVKTYPNVHKDYNNIPINSFDTIVSTFAETSPHVGIYDVAYDIWTNGVAASGSTEFMIWNENYNQVPGGSQVTTASFGGRTYNVWKTSNSGYIAFVPTVVFTSGSVDILEIFKWAMSKGWLPSNATVGQIDFGVEIVSTNSTNASFNFTDFSITTDSQHVSDKYPPNIRNPRTSALTVSCRPINSGVAIRIDGTDAEDVRVLVADMAGHLVASLSRKIAGGQMVWGTGTRRGIYAVTVFSGDRTAARKVILQ